MEEKNNQSQTRNTWLEVVGNIVLAFLLVIFLAFALSLAEQLIEKKLSDSSAASRPFWHSFLGVQTAYAAPLKGYEAMQVSMVGGNLTLSPGESKTVTVSFLNLGSVDWLNSGANYVSVYTYEPKYRTSVFADSSWFKNNQPAVLSEIKVSSKNSGTISFKLKAPNATGNYKETFALAAEDKTWIPGGQFTVTINVTNPSSSSSSSAPSAPSASLTNGYSATILMRSSKKPIKVGGGEVVYFTAGIKNSGEKTWNSRSIKLPDIKLASSISYKDSSWVDTKTAVVKNDAPVTPGAVDLISFKFKAPTKKGNYTVKFSLAVDEIDSVSGSELDIPIEVTSDAAETIDDEEISDVDEAEVLIDEPIIRVGVLIVDEETEDEVVVSCEGDFSVIDGDGDSLAKLDSGEEVRAYFKSGKYWYEIDEEKESTIEFLRFVPEEENTICEVTNFDRRVTRNTAYANNQFRNILELRHNDYKDRVWLINELPMEYYLRGLGETSDLSNLEFQKALLTAARTYALYHWERATKHAKEFFHVDAYADQVYYGYGQESRTPRITQAVEETRGRVVTYENKTAITPYFSRSDGRTRDWSEVWGGSVPWCLSVTTPHDIGKKLWGHGVGMSASEALMMGKEGVDWKEIVKYFYTGVELEKKWE